MRPQLPNAIEDPDERERRLREEDEERVLDQDERWLQEDRAGLGPWGARAHRMARRDRAQRAADEEGGRT